MTGISSLQHLEQIEEVLLEFVYGDDFRDKFLETMPGSDTAPSSRSELQPEWSREYAAVVNVVQHLNTTDSNRVQRTIHLGPFRAVLVRNTAQPRIPLS